MPGAVKHRLLNTPDALAYLGSSMSSKKLHCYRRDLGAVKLGGFWYWPANKLDDWVAGRIEVTPDDRPPSRKRKRRTRKVAA